MEKLMNTDRILFDICKCLTKGKTDAIYEALKMAGEAMGIDGCFMLQSEEVPFLFEVKYLWKKNEDMYLSNGMFLDLSENADDKAVNTFIGNVGDGYILCEDPDSFQGIGEIVPIIKRTGMESLIVFVLKSGNDYLGDVVFFTESPRKWSEEEFNFARDVSECISYRANEIRTINTFEYLLNESENTAKATKEASGRFVSNLSHEVRTPINAMVGMISIMRHNLENPDVLGECLERMEKSTKQIMETVNNCIDMSLIDKEEVTFSRSWFMVSELVTNLQKVVKAITEFRSIHFDFDYDESLSIYGDEAKIFKILTNAIINSCKLSQNDTNVMLLISKETSGNREMVTFRIKDEVAGISDEIAKHIFDPFIANQVSENFGNGLSFTVTKQLVEVVGGAVEFFSDGWGSELVIQIPLETRGGKKEEERDKEEENVDADIAEMYIGRRIMIAEDNVLMGEILATILGYHGLETDMAMNGQEALEKFTAHEPFYYDMILMDIQMPVMDGLEATEKIRNCGHADSAIIPIAALSANAFDEDVKRALESGMNVYLRKPVSEKELFAAISELVM